MLKFRHFLKRTFQLTFILIVILSVLSLDYFEFFQPVKYFTWISLFFFMAMTLVSGYYNSRSIRKKFFINIYLGTLGIKFIFSIGFILAFFLVFNPANKMVVIPYFLLFSVFKVFETVLLLKYSREAIGEQSLSKG